MAKQQRRGSTLADEWSRDMEMAEVYAAGHAEGFAAGLVLGAEAEQAWMHEACESCRWPAAAEKLKEMVKELKGRGRSKACWFCPCPGMFKDATNASDATSMTIDATGPDEE